MRTLWYTTITREITPLEKNMKDLLIYTLFTAIFFTMGILFVNAVDKEAEMQAKQNQKWAEEARISNYEFGIYE